MPTFATELSDDIAAIEVNAGLSPATHGRKAQGSIVLAGAGVRDRIDRAAFSTLVRNLDAVRFCNDGTGGIQEIADGPTQVKAACELLDRLHGRPAQTTLNLSADLGSGKLNASELLAGSPDVEKTLLDMLAQVRAAREKSGGAGSSAASAAQLDAGKQG